VFSAQQTAILSYKVNGKENNSMPFGSSVNEKNMSRNGLVGGRIFTFSCI
jgi:hypothetical protein